MRCIAEDGVVECGSVGEMEVWVGGKKTKLGFCQPPFAPRSPHRDWDNRSRKPHTKKSYQEIIVLSTGEEHAMHMG